MSDVNIYDETENLISSDEYSENDDELMNSAIISQNIIKSQSFNLTSSTNLNPIKNKELECKLIKKRNKLGILYKKKSIKCLNSKVKRENYKVLLGNLIYNRNANLIKNRKFNAVGKCTEIRNEILKDATNDKNAKMVEKTYCTEPFEIEQRIQIASPPNKEGVKMEIFAKTDKITQTDAKPNVGKNNIETQTEKNSNISNWNENKSTKSKNDIETQTEPQSPTGMESKSKRDGSPSPILEHRGKNSASDKSDNLAFHKEINKLFPKLDETLGNHVKLKSNSIEAIEEGMDQAFLEIQTLNKLIQSKEIEWNRLLYLKSVKEEIIKRLLRKKKLAELKTKTYADKYSLPELKELEYYLSTSRTATNNSATQQLIENRANMKRDELNRERSDTNRLQSLLASTNILPKTGKFDDNLVKMSKDIRLMTTNSTLPNSLDRREPYKYSDKKENKIEHQGHLKDVQTIMTDFRQNNTEVLHPVSKRFKCSEPIPINLREVRPTSEPNYVYIDEVDEDHFDRTGTNMLLENASAFCQKCRHHEARFACADCQNQWYCSRNCQISDWDDHSEICNK